MWENVNETKDRRTPALIWCRRNEERAKLSQDHVCADTWGTDEVEATVLIWMQIWKDGQRKQERWPTHLKLCLLQEEWQDQWGGWGGAQIAQIEILHDDIASLKVWVIILQLISRGCVTSWVYDKNKLELKPWLLFRRVQQRPYIISSDLWNLLNIMYMGIILILYYSL